MAQVAKISQQLAEEINGKYYNDSSVFNPVQDGNGNWVVSMPCIEGLQPEQYEMIEWVPPVFVEEEYTEEEEGE